LEERATFEKESIRSVLTELKHSIEKELAEPGVLQLILPTFEEQEQLKINLDALQRRLQEIPSEIEAEQENIEKRFSDPYERMFPVGVLFLLPEKYL
jgi:regulator of replication initiation timing